MSAPNATRWKIERYRALLLLRARLLLLDPRLQARFDASDLVNDALLKAWRGLEEFRGTTEAELIAWLQTILGNEAIRLIRHAFADRRTPALEQAWQAAIDDSTVRLDPPWLADKQPSPGELAQKHEMQLRLAAAMDKLLDDQRDVVILFYYHGLPAADIAAQLGRTESSVRKLLDRGRQRLRELLADESES
jgi:RNA polymerase sigma-70 factor (ECF subfamily)